MVSLGLIGASLFEGFGRGLASGAKKADERTERERVRLESRLDEILKDARVKKKTYDEAKDQKLQLVSYARSRLQALPSTTFSSSGHLNAAAANLVKSNPTAASLEKTLDLIEQNNQYFPDAVAQGFKLPEGFDPKTFEGVTDDVLAGRLVPEYLRPVSAEQRISMIKPYQPKGLFSGTGTPRSIQEEYDAAKAMAEGEGLTLDSVIQGDITQVPTPTDLREIPKGTGRQQVVNQLRDLIQSATDPNVIERLEAQLAVAQKQQQEDTYNTTTPDTSQFLSQGVTASLLNTAKDSVYFHYSGDNNMQTILQVSKGLEKDAQPTSAINTAKLDKAYQIYSDASRFIKNEASRNKQLAQIVTISGAEDNKIFETAHKIRLGTTTNITTFLNSLKRTNPDYLQKAKAPDETRAVHEALTTWKNLNDKEKLQSATALSQLLKDGFFVSQGDLSTFGSAGLIDMLEKIVNPKSVGGGGAGGGGAGGGSAGGGSAGGNTGNTSIVPYNTEYLGVVEPSA